MFTFGAPYYTYISDEYAVAKRELGIVKVENELLPVLIAVEIFVYALLNIMGLTKSA